METFIELLNALAPYAWPATTVLLVLFIVILFEEAIAERIRNLSSLSTPLGTATFADAVEQAREAIETLEVQPEEVELHEELASDIAQYPRVAVLESWIRLERTARDALRLVSPSGDRTPRRDILRSLRETGLVDNSASMMLRRLRIARNRAAHEADWGLDPETVREYVMMAEEMRLRIESAASRRGNQPDISSPPPPRES